jgi:hypothetical protein
MNEAENPPKAAAAEAKPWSPKAEIFPVTAIEAAESSNRSRATPDRQAVAVRSASLVERRGFEPPVSFGSFASGRPFGIRSFSAGMCDDSRRRKLSLCGFFGMAALKSPESRAFRECTECKEDRQFESPLLQQRGTANRRLRMGGSLRL